MTLHTSPQLVFIAGFEKCMTTSLAACLLEGGDCELLVPGVKEPWLFSSAPAEATQRVVGRLRQGGAVKPLLDASVSYVGSDRALEAIAQLEADYRLLVCVRNQFARTVSAYRYYRVLMTRRLDEIDSIPPEQWPEPIARLRRSDKLGNSCLTALISHYYAAFGVVPHEFFGPDLGLALGESGEGLPAHYFERPVGNYLGTAIAAAASGARQTKQVVADMDEECARLSTQSLPERVLYELRRLKRNDTLPLINIIGDSFYAPRIKAMLTLNDPARVITISMDAVVRDPGRLVNLRRLLGATDASRGAALRHSNETLRSRGNVDDHALGIAEGLLRQPFANDTRAMLAAMDASADLERALFDPARLCA